MRLKSIVSDIRAGIVGGAAWVLVTVVGTVLLGFLKGMRGPWILVGLGSIAGVLLVFLAALGVTAFRSLKKRILAWRRPLLVGRKGWLDFEVDWRKVSEEFVKTATRLAREIGKVGETFITGKKRLEAAGGLAVFAPEILQKASAKTARELYKCAMRLEGTLSVLKAIADRLTENQTGRMQARVNDKNALTIYRNEVVSLRDAASVSLGHQESFRSTLANFNSPTQELDAANTKLIAVVDGIAAMFRFIVDHSAKVLSTVDEAMQSADGGEEPTPETAGP